jgi:diguanylate cyclase (GGDEF)-like protein
MINSLLYQISRNFQAGLDRLDDVLKENLFLLVKNFPFDRASIYLLDATQKALRPAQIASLDGMTEGEGESFFITKKKSNFLLALDLEKEVVCPREPEFSVYLPLIANKKKLGVLKLDNMQSHRPIKREFVKKIKPFTEIFSFGLYNGNMYDMSLRQINRLTTLAQTEAAIATTLKLEEILEITLSSLVKNLGYDRAQIFLIDEQTKTVKKNLGIDFRGYYKTYENFLQIPPEIRALLSHEKPYFLSTKFASNLLAYIPITWKAEKKGLLIVDNLFSRQALTAYDLSFLGILTDHIARAVQNSLLFEKIETLSITDSLTGLFNHRYFYERLGEEVARAQRFSSRLSLLMIDIDFFKAFNDTYGHQAGDNVLKVVSRIIQDTIRAHDIASRYGGEEIAIILPETDVLGTRIIAERIRERIKKHDFVVNKKSNHITVSIGLVCFPEDADVKTELVTKADQALYWVKNHGRDGVCVYSEKF